MKFYLRSGQLPILIVNIIFLLAFSLVFGYQKNYEFILYIGVIIFFLILIIITNWKVFYPNPLLWGLTLWSLLHMIGGGIYIGGQKVYTLMIFTISEEYGIFRFDQLVHIIGFAVATLLAYYLIKPSLREDLGKFTALSIVIAMAGLGFGALNEIVEFSATVILPETGVGGYINTSLDLVADLFGAILAIIYLYFVEFKKMKK